MKRRELLRKTSTGLAIGVGATGTAAAGSKGELPASVEFEPAAARAAFAAHGDLLDELAAEGVLDAADLGAFDFGTRLDSLADADGVGVTPAMVAGTRTELYTATRSVDGGRLVVHALPDGSDAFAALEDGDGEVLETFGGVQADVSPRPSCPPCYEEICTCDDDSCGWCCSWSCYCSCTCDPCPTPS